MVRPVPAGTEAREDICLLAPRLPGLSVKVRGGGALEVKAYRGSPGILAVAGRARGRMEFWQKWSFPFTPPGAGRAVPPGWRLVRKRRRISRFSLASGQIVARARGRARSRDVRWNSPKSTPAARTGGRWGSRRPAPPVCSAAVLRLPPRSCSPTPCPVRNWAQMNPGLMRSGWASGRAPAVTPAREGCPAGEPTGPRVPAGTVDPHRAKRCPGDGLARRHQLGAPRPGPGGRAHRSAGPGRTCCSVGMVSPRLMGRGSAVGGTRIRPGRAPLAPRPAAARFTQPRVMPG